MIPPGLRDSLLFHLEAALRVVNRRSERLLQEKLGLGVRESLILQAASSDPPLSQGCMADCLGVNRNVMVLEIDRLDVDVHEDKSGARIRGAGYLKRERREESRREATIVLTAKGKRMLAAIHKLRAQVWRDVLRPTNPGQRADLIAWAREIIEQDSPVAVIKAKRQNKLR
jgi:hypothetical protein